MTLHSFESPQACDVGQARAAASDLHGALEYLKPLTEKARAKVRGAKSVDKVVRYYADWLGAWHSCNVALTFYLHGSGGFTTRHAVAFLQIKSVLGAIDRHIAEKAPWISLPNLDRTRLNIEVQLSAVAALIDSAMSQCEVLAGHEATGRAA